MRSRRCCACRPWWPKPLSWGRRTSGSGRSPWRSSSRRATSADDALIALCRDHLTPYKIPIDFVRVDALPKNEIGKVLRRELAAGYTR